ncbi:hypothetical protein [Carboxydothermus pertinax]|uniref:hypothetical protein n=1 Tax=Carboxydothermus pertinax TaxID=870242 RepID=UPI00096A2ED8|nr:hypothetical protein [Carboxydothermus pertinax]
MVLKTKFKESVNIGFLSFSLPFAGVLLYAYFVYIGPFRTQRYYSFRYFGCCGDAVMIETGLNVDLPLVLFPLCLVLTMVILTRHYTILVT